MTQIDDTLTELDRALRTKHPEPSVERTALVHAADQLRALRVEVDSLKAKLGEVHDTDPVLITFQAYAARVQRAIHASGVHVDGYPTGASGSGDGTSRTEALGTRHAYGTEVEEDGPMTGPHDPHGAQRRAMERWVERGADLVAQLAPSNKAGDHLRSQASDACPPSCCQSCWDTGTRTPTKNPGGVLCRWCGDTARALGLDAPPRSLVDKHNRGLRITDRDVRSATAGRHGA